MVTPHARSSICCRLLTVLASVLRLWDGHITPPFYLSFRDELYVSRYFEINAVTVHDHSPRQRFVICAILSAPNAGGRNESTTQLEFRTCQFFLWVSVNYVLPRGHLHCIIFWTRLIYAIKNLKIYRDQHKLFISKFLWCRD